MQASERDTIPIKIVLLAVGVGSGALARLRAAGGELGVRVATCTEGEARSAASALLPHVLAIPSALRRESSVYDDLCAETCARLLEADDTNDLEARLEAICRQAGPASIPPPT